jgi:hypothetical protein
VRLRWPLTRTAIAIGVLLAASGVAAAEAEDAYSAALTRAIAAKERALDVNEPPRWEEALHLFQEATALRATREAAYEIGFAAERLSRTDLAVESYEAAIALGLSGPPSARAGAFVAAHAPALARLEVRGPPGARLSIAGVERGRLPLPRPLVLFPGEGEIQVAETGGRTSTVTFHLEAGKNDVLDLAAGLPGEPLSRAKPPIAPAAPPAPEPRKTSAAAWSLIVSGLAVAVAAAVFVPVSQGKIDDNRTTLAATCNAPPVDDVCATAMNGKRDAAQSSENAIATWKAVRVGAWIGFGVGAAAAVTGAVLKLSGGGTPQVTALVVPAGDRRPTIAVAWGLRF